MKIDLWIVILAQIACVAIGYWRGWRHASWKHELQEQEKLRREQTEDD